MDHCCGGEGGSEGRGGGKRERERERERERDLKSNFHLCKVRGKLCCALNQFVACTSPSLPF